MYYSHHHLAELAMSIGRRKFIQGEWAWIGEHILTPCAVGALGRQCWVVPQGLFRPLFPVIGLLISLLLAFLRCRSSLAETAGKSPRRKPYDECGLLGGASLGAIAHLVITLSGRQEAYLARFIALAAGLAAMVIITFNDYRAQQERAELYIFGLFPWLTAIKLGVLGDWLITRLPIHGRFVMADQSTVSLVILAAMASLLAFPRRSIIGRGRSGGAYPSLQGTSNERALFAWGGYIGPGILLVLTITAGWVYFALLAWGLLLWGEGLSYY